MPLSIVVYDAEGRRRKTGGDRFSIAARALVHNDKECRVEAQMEPVAVFDFHRGIDFARFALVARRLNHNVTVVCARFEHGAVGRSKTLGVPAPVFEPNAQMLA